MTIAWDFSSRSILVSGAAQGIGEAIVRFFRAAGAEVYALDLDLDRLRGVFADDDAVVPIAADVSDADAIAKVFAPGGPVSGGVDVLVNNAGITRDAMVWKIDDTQWADVIGVHLTGTFRLSRAVIPGMRAKSYGRIINVTSYTGLHGNRGQANYAAAKAGIVGFTKSTAKDVARFGITVNALSPNAATPMVKAVPEQELARLASTIPLGRFADPHEICPAVGFLASDEAAYITGAVLPVDGGMAM